MEEVTQQNAALVEESAVTAYSMHKQSEILMRAVRIFRLDADYAMQHKDARHIAQPHLTRRPKLPHALLGLKHIATQGIRKPLYGIAKKHGYIGMPLRRIATPAPGVAMLRAATQHRDMVN